MNNFKEREKIYKISVKIEKNKVEIVTGVAKFEISVKYKKVNEEKIISI